MDRTTDTALGRPGAKPDGTPHRVLVGIGSAHLLKQVSDHLATAGFQTTATTADGRETVITYKKLDGTVDLVILDAALPGQDGCTTLAALRAHDPDVRAILVSDTDDQETAFKATALGAKDYLTTPLTPHDFITRLADALN
ncbi:response regulator [Kitasatospora sp. NPDC101801]|uniref:response regulator n=1 Tax=Kitasatospora sp. NPDC101801 TaxID=3364103 RepID=UPI0038148E07